MDDYGCVFWSILHKAKAIKSSHHDLGSSIDSATFGATTTMVVNVATSSLAA